MGLHWAPWRTPSRPLRDWGQATLPTFHLLSYLEEKEVGQPGVGKRGRGDGGADLGPEALSPPGDVLEGTTDQLGDLIADSRDVLQKAVSQGHRLLKSFLGNFGPNLG